MTGRFIAAYHVSVPEGSVSRYPVFGSVEPITRVKYVGVTDLSVHVTLDDGTNIRITNPGTFTDGLKVEVRKPDADS